jgi:hypothetical protein
MFQPMIEPILHGYHRLRFNLSIGPIAFGDYDSSIFRITVTRTIDLILWLESSTYLTRSQFWLLHGFKPYRESRCSLDRNGEDSSRSGSGYDRGGNRPRDRAIPRFPTCTVSWLVFFPRHEVVCELLGKHSTFEGSLVVSPELRAFASNVSWRMDTFAFSRSNYLLQVPIRVL